MPAAPAITATTAHAASPPCTHVMSTTRAMNISETEPATPAATTGPGAAFHGTATGFNGLNQVVRNRQETP